MNLIILLPKFDLSGPIKGAIAIGKLMAKRNKVTIIFLKGEVEFSTKNYTGIKFISLKKYKNYFMKIFKLRREIRKIKNNYYKNTTLLSMCFSADFLSLFTFDIVSRVSSIRGNLIKNYQFKYHLFGYFLAVFHLFILRFFNKVIVMNKTMQTQVKTFSKKDSIILPNFIDEYEVSEYLNKHIDKLNHFNLMFVGSLDKRKNPLLIIDLIEKISKKINIILHIIGKGPLEEKIKKVVNKKKLKNKILFHGFKEKPYKLMANADLFILPSYSEGTSRAVLESLCLGVPCLIRDVDSNHELINSKSNNVQLFKYDHQLENLIIKGLIDSRNRSQRDNLLPRKYRMNNIKQQLTNILSNFN